MRPRSGQSCKVPGRLRRRRREIDVAPTAKVTIALGYSEGWTAGLLVLVRPTRGGLLCVVVSWDVIIPGDPSEDLHRALPV